MEIIWLQRPHESIPWGFRLQGGREFGQPLAVQRVCTLFLIYNGLLATIPHLRKSFNQVHAHLITPNSN